MKSLTRSVIGFALVALLAPLSVSAQQGGLSVSEASIATNVVDRMPTGVANSFMSSVDRVYAWTRIEGASSETMIHHVWIHQGVERADIALRIGGSPWRTWSNKAVPPEWDGDWRVEVRDSGGNVLETLSFTIGG